MQASARQYLLMFIANWSLNKSEDSLLAWNADHVQTVEVDPSTAPIVEQANSVNICYIVFFTNRTLIILA